MKLLEGGQSLLLRFPVSCSSFGEREPVPDHFVVGIDLRRMFQRSNSKLRLSTRAETVAKSSVVQNHL